MVLQKLKRVFPAVILTIVLIAWLAFHKVPLEVEKMHFGFVDVPSVVARMNYKMQGCFGGYDAEIIIYRESQNTYLARLNIDYKLHAATRLDEGQMNYFKEFVFAIKELELKYSCTLTQNYQVDMPNFRLERDIGCGGIEFETLKNKLFTS